MEKKGLCVFFILFFIASISFAVAEDNATKIDKAYNCIENKTQGKCLDISLDEKIFTVLALEKCGDELFSASNENKCWPSSACTIKQTAQAVLALDKIGSDTSIAEEWLLSQNSTPDEVTWYLEIESTEATTCSIDYSGSSYNINIGEDKKITGSAGSCLTRAQDDYWLRISSNCFNQEFSITCDKSFLTTLLFKKDNSNTIHVLEEAHSGSSTTEKVNSFCFAQSGSCNYEGSLWATLVLNSLGYDVSSYLPYLITMADDNSEFLPESFLYLLTDSTDYRTSLLEAQLSDKWWDESGNKYYDTAVALYPFQFDDPIKKTNSKTWLLENQDNQGCWQGNLKDTAFLLYSIWPRNFGNNNNGNEADCEDAGYFCRSSSTSCSDDNGEVFTELSCLGASVCCSVEEIIPTCTEQEGEVCSSDEECSSEGIPQDASGLTSGETCCVRGTCEAVQNEPATCTSDIGICSETCSADEDIDYEHTCDYDLDSCCVPKATPQGEGMSWWIWVLIILIILVILGIIFRNKLRVFWFRIKSKGLSRPSPRPGYPPSPPMAPRRIPNMLPPQRRQVSQVPRRQSRDVEEVLKKLKEMGR